MDRLTKLTDMERDKPSDPFIKYALALEFKSIGNFEKSRTLFEVLTSDYAEYLPTYYQFGQMEEEAGNLFAARAIYEMGVTVARAGHDVKTERELVAAIEALDE